MKIWKDEKNDCYRFDEIDPEFILRRATSEHPRVEFFLIEKDNKDYLFGLSAFQGSTPFGIRIVGFTAEALRDFSEERFVSYCSKVLFS